VSNKGTKNKSDPNIISNLIITEVPNDAENISFSYDDKYCTYLYNSEIYIKDIATNKLIRKITENTGKLDYYTTCTAINGEVVIRC
jgi:uncharacterized protein with WD repeat